MSGHRAVSSQALVTAFFVAHIELYWNAYIILLPIDKGDNFDFSRMALHCADS